MSQRYCYSQGPIKYGYVGMEAANISRVYHSEINKRGNVRTINVTLRRVRTPIIAV